MTPAADPSAARRCPRALVFAVLLAASVAPALAGCLRTTQASRIEQGEAFSTGKEMYDAFFEAVRAARDEASRAAEEVSGARADLVRGLGLSSGAGAGATVDAARARAARLKEEGVLLHLEIAPEAKLLTESGRARVGAEDKSVFEAVEASVKGSLAASKRLVDLSRRAAELETTRATLEAASREAFADGSPTQRDDVARELAAAAKVLAEVVELGDKHAGLASRFVIDLALAVETGARPTTKRAAGGRPTTVKTPARGGRNPPPRGAPPAAPPKPKPAGGDDFDP